MRRLLLLFFSFCLLPEGYRASAATAPVPDSLRRALRAAPTERARAEVLLRIVDYFSHYEHDSAAHLGHAYAAVRLGRRLGDSVLVGRALDRGSTYYLTIQHFEPAVVLERQAERLLAEGPPLHRARNAYNLAWAYVNLRQPQRAKKYYQAASRLFDKAHDPSKKASILMELGILYQNAGRYDTAITYMFQAVKLHHQQQDVYHEATDLTNVASVFTQLRQLSVSSNYCRQAYRLAATIADSSLMAVAMQGLGANAQKADSPAVALRYLRREQELVRHLQFYSNRSGLYSNLADVSRKLHQPDSVAYYYQTAIAVARRTHDPDRILGLMMTSLANFYQEQQQPALAADWARQALALNHGEPGQAYTENALALLQTLALARHDYPAAYALLKRQMQVRDTLLARANTRQLEEVRASYEVDKAEQQVVALQQDQELARLRRQREWAGGAGLLLLTVGAAGAGAVRYRRRQRGREDALRTRLAADLHDDVGSLLTQISLESSWLKAGTRSPAQLTQHLDHLADASRRAVQQLSDVVWGIDARNDATGPLIERLRDHAHETLSVAGLDIDFAADPALADLALPLLVRQNLYLIYKEALHNAVKHAQATQVTVRLWPEADALLLLVQDNGRGYTGTGRPGGQGRRNMEARAAACGGSLAFETAGPGFGVRLRLPV